MINVINPKIFIFNFNSGSGVETTGNTIIKMFEDKDPKTIFAYRNQNPPYMMYQKLLEEKPDIIIINELFHRVLDAVFYYKETYPDTKVILLNHCFPNLVDIDKQKYGEASHDQKVLIKYFLKHGIDHIINLNHRPPHIQYDKAVLNKIKEIYFPIDDKFKIITPWAERKKDFMFYGTLASLKFSSEFLDLLEKTNIHIDIFGRKDFGNDPSKEQLDHVKRMLSSPNLTYKGYIPHEELISTINEYRFYIVPHKGSEPFMLTIAEAIRCGTIPLVTNNRNDLNSFWIDWAKDCYLEYNEPKRMLDKMMYYMNNKTNGGIVRPLDDKSKQISKIMTERTNFSKFKNYLYSIVYDI